MRRDFGGVGSMRISGGPIGSQGPDRRTALALLVLCLREVGPDRLHGESGIVNEAREGRRTKKPEPKWKREEGGTSITFGKLLDAADDPRAGVIRRLERQRDLPSRAGIDELPATILAWPHGRKSRGNVVQGADEPS